MSRTNQTNGTNREVELGKIQELRVLYKVDTTTKYIQSELAMAKHYTLAVGLPSGQAINLERVYGLVRYHGRRGQGCWASVQTLAEEASLDVRTVRSCLRRLVEDSFLVKEDRPGRTALYRTTDELVRMLEESEWGKDYLTAVEEDQIGENDSPGRVYVE